MTSMFMLCITNVNDIWKRIARLFGKKYDRRAPETPQHEYFEAHKCYLSPDKLDTNQIKCSWIRRCILNLVSPNMGDIRAQKMYRSYAALCAQKYIQYKHYPLSVHPFSKLRVWTETFFLMRIFFSYTLLAFHFSEPHPGDHELHIMILIYFDVLYLAIIVMNFFTGYIEGKTSRYVVLDLKKIAYKYARTWLLLDILSTMYLIPAVSQNINDHVNLHLFLISLKIFRAPVALIYLDNMLTVKRAGIMKKILGKSFLLLKFYLTWNIYFQYAIEYMAEGSFRPENPRNCSWITLSKMWNSSLSVRFSYALDRSVAMLKETSNINSTKKPLGCSDNFMVISWFIARILVVHCTLKYMIALIGSASAKAKYFIMTTQAETLMDKRNFPPRIKRKILKFYAIRFQSNFFAESNMLASVTRQLREDIIMHTGRQLVRELEFLKHLPRSLLLQIGLKLKMVVFLAGDIIFKINTTGDCLYFIDKGTVAIYSESGNEICHLEDGDYFGEIALLMKQSIRTASAVAVTNCELFKLDKQDFDSTIAIYPTVYENIKKVAISRFERTCVLDEHHKIELKMEEEHEFKVFGDQDYESNN